MKCPVSNPELVGYRYSHREIETESSAITLIGLYRRIPQQPHGRQAAGRRQRLVAVVEEVRVLHTCSQCNSHDALHICPIGYSVSQKNPPPPKFSDISPISNYDEVMPYSAQPPSSHHNAQNVHHWPKRTLAFSDILPKQLGIFSSNFTYLLHVHIYARLQIFIQLSPTVTKLCHIKCDHPACVSADGGHFEHMMVAALKMA